MPRGGHTYKPVSTKEPKDIELNPIDVELKITEEAACFICPSGDGWSKRKITLTGKKGSCKIKITGGEEGPVEEVVHNVQFQKGQGEYGGLFVVYNNTDHSFKATSLECANTMRKMETDYKARGKPGSKYGAAGESAEAEKLEHEIAKLTDDEKDLMQGIMWCGTIFAWDKDGDGSIDTSASSEEFQLMTEVANGEDEAPPSTDDPIADGREMSAAEQKKATSPGKLAMRVLKGHIFGKVATWKKLQQEENITFELKKQNVKCVILYVPKMHMIMFSLAGLMTAISVMDEFQNALLKKGGTLHALEQKHKNNTGRGEGFNLLKEATAQERANYDAQVIAEIQTQNARNFQLLLNKKQTDQNLETLKAQYRQNMTAISERRVRIKRNKNLAQDVAKTTDGLDGKTTVVAEIAWWLKWKCRFIICFSISLAVIIICTVVYLYLDGS